MKIRYRFYGPDEIPMHGDYLMSHHGRGGYLILGVDNRGERGGLGEPVYCLIVLDVERVSRAECVQNGAGRPGPELWALKWDRRKRRASPKAAA